MFIVDSNKDYVKETESRVVVRFQDCDPLRHLNNAKYFDYYFNAREDQVPKLYGLEILDFIKSFEAVWVVYNHHIAYLKSANLGEWVRIVTRVVFFDHDSVVVEYCMTDDDKTHLKSLLWTTFKYVGMKTSKTVDHTGAVLDYLHAVKYPGVEFDSINFDQRVNQVKAEVRGMG